MVNNLQLNDMGVAQYKEIAEGNGCRKHWRSGLVNWYEARARRPLNGQSLDCVFWH